MGQEDLGDEALGDEDLGDEALGTGVGGATIRTENSDRGCQRIPPNTNLNLQRRQCGMALATYLS
jgi:hypothetical protein